MLKGLHCYRNPSRAQTTTLQIHPLHPWAVENKGSSPFPWSYLGSEVGYWMKKNSPAWEHPWVLLQGLGNKPNLKKQTISKNKHTNQSNKAEIRTLPIKHMPGMELYMIQVKEPNFKPQQQPVSIRRDRDPGRNWKAQWKALEKNSPRSTRKDLFFDRLKAQTRAWICSVVLEGISQGARISWSPG